MLNKLAHNIMKLFNSNSKFDSPLALNTIVKVNHLSTFDMIYVYHLLSLGTKVHLYKTNTTLSGDLIFDVFYKTFKLGSIQIGGLSKKYLSDLVEMSGVISNLSKEKYLPIKSLEITLNTSESLKMVS